MRLVVWFIFDAFKAQGLRGANNGSAQVSDGVCSVLKVKTIARGVQPVDGSQPVKMVQPRLVGVEGINASSDAPRYMIYC